MNQFSEEAEPSPEDKLYGIRFRKKKKRRKSLSLSLSGCFSVGRLSLHALLGRFLLASFSSPCHLGSADISFAVNEIQIASYSLHAHASYNLNFRFAFRAASTAHGCTGHISMLVEEIQVPRRFLHSNMLNDF